MRDDEHSRPFHMRVHPRVVGQAEFNSSIAQNNKMNHSFKILLYPEVR